MVTIGQYFLRKVSKNIISKSEQTGTPNPSSRKGTNKTQNKIYVNFGGALMMVIWGVVLRSVLQQTLASD